MLIGKLQAKQNGEELELDRQLPRDTSSFMKIPRWFFLRCFFLVGSGSSVDERQPDIGMNVTVFDPIQTATRKAVISGRR
jgi:hypothetical protein